MFMNLITSYFRNEYGHFKNLNPNCRKLVVANFAYSFVFLILPIIANYFIFKEYEGLGQSEVIPYSVAYFVGYFTIIPVGFAINGYLLRHFKVNHLYIVGMLAEIFVIIPLAFLHIQGMFTLFLVGCIMGVSSGLFWANRHYMSYFVTDNMNRNYVFGLENTLMTLGGFFTPLVFGFLTGMNGFTLTNLFPGLPVDAGKVILAAFLLTLILIASFTILKGTFVNPVLKSVISFRYSKIWNKQRLLNTIEGFAYGPLIVMPSLIFLYIFKDGGSLGLVESIGIIIALVPVYLIGRYTKPRHRRYILLGTGIVLLSAAIILAIFFNKPAGVIFSFCSKIVFTVLYMPFLAVRMRSMNLAIAFDKKDEYSYFIDIELFMAIGRALGLGVFLAAYYYFSQILSLKYGFLIIGMIPIIYSVIVGSITQEDEHTVKEK
jgi:YQGE family putative transporter